MILCSRGHDIFWRHDSWHLFDWLLLPKENKGLALHFQRECKRYIIYSVHNGDCRKMQTLNAQGNTVGNRWKQSAQGKQSEEGLPTIEADDDDTPLWTIWCVPAARVLLHPQRTPYAVELAMGSTPPTGGRGCSAAPVVICQWCH